MNGIEFYEFLKTELHPGVYLGRYKFIKWLENGNLQFEINKKQKKSIPPELIMLAYHIKKRNNRIKFEIRIDNIWLVNNGYTDWCFIDVINFLIRTYNFQPQNTEN